MATEKKRSKGRFLYLFDWNAKSKKKLFSNKSESSEESTYGKENVDNVAISQYFLRELHENGDRSSFRGSGYYSCASSVDGDEGYGIKAPGVVARLMGLDAMPTTSSNEAAGVPSYNSHDATSGSYYPGGHGVFPHDNHILDYSYPVNKVEGLPWNSMGSRTTKIRGRPIERFQTEVLPPKSAKPISITHHRLLSPIKSPGFIPSKDAAYIMEAAARIIESSPQPNTKAKISLGSPSSSFRIQDLKERVDAAQRLSKMPESSKTPKHSSPARQMREKPSDRSSSRSLFRNIMGMETSSSHKVKNKGKSISAPVQEKANVRKKDGPSHSHRRRQLQKEPKPAKSRDKQASLPKAGQTRTSRSKSSGVLRPNNDKQNSISEKAKTTTKTSVIDQLPRKLSLADSSVGPSKVVSKVFVSAENRKKKAVATTSAGDRGASANGVIDKRPSLNKIKNISRNKQFPARNDRISERGSRDERAVRSDLSLQGDSRKDMDVISFTFTSPIKKTSSQSLSAIEDFNHQQQNFGDSVELNGHARSSSTPSLGLNLVDSGALSLLLEQKLKELADKIGSSKSESVVEDPDTDSLSCLSESITSHDVGSAGLMECDEWSDKDNKYAAADDDCSSSIGARSSQDRKDVEEHNSDTDANKCEPVGDSDLSHPNIFIPECSISGSCTSDFTYGYDQPSSPQSQEETSGITAESLQPREDETDIADSVYYWELEYVRHVLHYAGLNTLGFSENWNIIDPSVFDLLENLINTSERNAELFTKLDRRILFDCVDEIVSTMYECVYIGSKKAWTKWGMLLLNERLTEEVYTELIRLQDMGNMMVDELVDRDMSTHYGRWLDFEVESLEEGMEIEMEIVSDLVDELVADLSI